MATETVKWFNATIGYSFIQPDAGGLYVFLHVGTVERAGIRDLREGQKVAYEVAVYSQRANPQRKTVNSDKGPNTARSTLLCY